MRKCYILSTIVFLFSTVLFGQTLFKGTVMDAETSLPIANAKVGVVGQGVGVFTSESGFFSYRKYNQILEAQSALVVGANGYQTLRLNSAQLRNLGAMPATIILQKATTPEMPSPTNRVAVFWDISESMIGRNTQAELDFLEAYLAKLGSVEVRFVIFSYDIQKEYTLTIKAGNIERFRESVSSITYNGPSNYQMVSLADADKVLLFSSGLDTYGTLDVSQDIPVCAVVSSRVERDDSFLNALARYTNGQVVVADKQRIPMTSSNSVENRNAIPTVATAQIKPTIVGVLTSLGKPIQGASLMIKGALAEYSTTAMGRFEISAKKGDVLQVRYMGMFPKEILIENNEEMLTIDLTPENEVLDEVVLEERIKRFNVGDKIIKGTSVPYASGGVTALGDFFVTGEDIRPNGLTLEYVLRNLFAGITITQSPTEGPVVKVKGSTPQWILNGFLLNPGEPTPLYIADDEIESIVLKESQALTTRYGPLVEGLAIIVTTKSHASVREKLVNSALIKGNDYTEVLQTIENTLVAPASLQGTVTSLGKPLQNVTVGVKGSFKEAQTDANGVFSVDAKPGDILYIRHIGMFSKDVVVTEKEVSIELLPQSDVLDEVELEGKVSEYPDTVSGSGYIPALGIYRLGNQKFSVITLTKEDIPFEHLTTLGPSLNGKLAGVQADEEGVYLRGATPSYWIDGIPVDYEQVKSFSPSLVESISFKKDRVGFVAGYSGPAMFIETIHNQKTRTPQSSLVTGNEYTDEIPTINTLERSLITGSVSSPSGPIQGATLLRKGSFDEYTTQSNGSFAIPAKEGDVFIVTYLGMFPKEFVVGTEKEYIIALLPENDLLDEVTLDSKKETDRDRSFADRDAQYANKSYAAKVLLKEEILKTGATNLKDILPGKVSGITKSDNLLRNPRTGAGNQAVPYKIVFDNQLYDQNILDVIDPQIIAKVEVISGLQGSIRYGPEARNGIIVITRDYGTEGLKRTPKSALVSGNEYQEEVQSLEEPALGPISLTIGGTVTASGQPLADVTVIKKGTFTETTTDLQGAYTIKAALQDILVLSKTGYFTKEVVVENASLATIELIPNNSALEEVVVAAAQRVDNTVETGMGKRSEDAVGYAVDEIRPEGTFSQGYTNLQQLITGKVAGVTVSGGLYSGSEVIYKIRGGTQSINTEKDPIWIVNGTPYQDPPTFLDVQQIVSITVLKSVIATSRYGSLAAGGAFLIKTKENNFETKDEAQQRALVTGNEYQENTARISETDLPAYILRFRESGTPQQQFEVYKNMARTQESPLEFYVDAANYFQSIDPTLGAAVRTDLAYISRSNTKALRTLGYLYDRVGDTKNAVTVAQRILKIAPQESQSYRDLALAYQNNGDYNKALELYINMLGEQIYGVNFEGIEKPLRSELSHLVALHKDKINYERLPNEWLRTDFDIDIRMVIEWSDRGAPFEFQFVNPDKKFFKWTHALQENRERLEAEQKQGYQMETFIIDDAPSGEWLINVQYLGTESDYVLPPFLKFTQYTNYGTTTETKEVRIVKLFKQTDKVTLGKVVL